MQILVAIPVFNELTHVQKVLDKVLGIHSDLLLVDDGSTDGTAEYLAARKDIRLIAHPNNRGYGRSVIDSFTYACDNGFDWVITMDCDEQHDPERIPRFIREIRKDKWDIISGSRYLQPRKDDDLPPGDRRMINSTITAMINETFGWGITDAFCGFKAHRTSAMVGLKLDEPGYAFPMQMWPRVAAANLRITEIPVQLIYNDPNRHFGGALDDSQVRLKHYLSVFDRELAWQPVPMTREDCPCCCPE